MKKYIIIFVAILILVGGGFGVYTYFVKSTDVLIDPDQELQLTEDAVQVEDLFLAEIRSFKVPVLHNSVAVKFLVFHVILNVEDTRSVKAVQSRMNHLVDMYIRYLVAHYEVNSAGKVLNRTELNRILTQATHEVMGKRIMLKNVIIQGVFEKNTG